MLKELEEAAGLHGLKFNKGKCVVIAMYGNPDIHFKDGTRMKKVEEAIYLGAKLTRDGEIRQEINKIIRDKGHGGNPK